MLVAHIDFETFSNLDVTDVGAYRYAEDPSTEVLICCYAIGDGPVRTWLPFKQPRMPAELEQHVRRGAKLGAHNAQFERAIWHGVLVPRHGAPRTKPGQWVCTAVLAAQAGLPRGLDGATTAIGVQHKKNPIGKKLIKLFCARRKPTKKDPRTRIHPHEAPEDFNAFIGYCREDVLAERDLCHRLPPLPEFDARIFELDFIVNERGLPIDIPMVQRALPIAEELGRNMEARTVELTGVRPTQVQKLREWIVGEGCELNNLQRGTLELAVVHPDTPPHVREVLELRMEAGLVSHKKFYSMLRVCSPADGRARGTIMFYGAHTGRWSGKLIQPHNFKRGNYRDKAHQELEQRLMFDALWYGSAPLLTALWPDPMLALSMCMRGFIKAPDGKVLRVVDYSAIEARVLAWVAGEQWLIEAFIRGVDVYKLMASFLYSIPVEAVSSEQRRIAKNLVLGCGYQLGAKKFVEYCARAGVYITPEQSEEAVGTYRQRNQRIVACWGSVERAAIAAVQTGKGVRWRMLEFEVQDVWLTVRLPSGRRLYYLHPKVQTVITYNKPKLQLTFREEFKGQMYRNSTYGGKLVENIVQGIARDLMANGMLEAEKDSLPIIGTVHDELINEGDEGDGRTVEEFEHAVCRLPDWGHGIPIGAEGFQTTRYKKG
jgi:DNA polymerase